MVSGIDEAGRGSVFGSLIIVGITLDQKVVNNLVKNGLKDSKLFSSPHGQKKRADLAIKILELALESKVIEITAKMIDETLSNRPKDNLNYLEIRNIGKIILELSSENIWIDSISNPEYFKKHLLKNLDGMVNHLNIKTESNKPKKSVFSITASSIGNKRLVISEKADRIFPIVSAASCVAKYIRDKNLRKIEKEWNLQPYCMGKGYPNEKDSNMMNFLRKYHEEIRERLFPFIRYSWSWPPLQQIIKAPIISLDEFLDE